jgi:pSer/pThr/pTyr-binding forkhead associated (FHA) protein
VVIDHVAGSRRGQRQELPAEGRVRFGRHPDCEVSFDPHRDIDASSRHAELRRLESGWVLVDLGSSNGTYVEGHRVTETPIAQAVAVAVEFGPGGPRVRLFLGDDAAIRALPPPAIEKAQRRWLVPAIAGAVALVLVLVAVMKC